MSETIGERVAKRRRLLDKVGLTLLIDRSASTGDFGRFKSIQKYVREQLSSNKKGEIDLKGIFYFSNSLNEVEDFTEDKINEMYPDGATSLFKYIHEIGEKILTENEGDLANLSFVVVTDGENTTDGGFWNSAIATIKKLKDRNCKILYAGIESNPFAEISAQALNLGYPNECVLSINCYDRNYMDNGLQSLRQVSTNITSTGFSQTQRQSSQPVDNLFDSDSGSVLPLPPPLVPIPDKKPKLNRLGASKRTNGY